MLTRSRIAGAILAALCHVTVAAAADQTVRGSQLVLANPGLPYRRKLTIKASEQPTDNSIVGDPTVAGATLTATVHGTRPSTQTYSLRQSTSALTHRPFWTGDFARGFTYRDSRGEQGAVTKLQIKLSRGIFRITAAIDGRQGPIDLVPPDDGTDGCVLLSITGGDSYSIEFADGLVVNDGGTTFKVLKPVRQGHCADTATTPSSTTSTSSTSSTTTTSSGSIPITTTSTVPDLRPSAWLFGDSVTNSYCPLVARDHPDWNVQCMGRSGEGTADALARLDSALSTSISPPDALVIQGGLDDCAAASDIFAIVDGTLSCDSPNPFAADLVAANLQEMAESGRAHGSAPIIASTLYRCPVPSADTCMALPLDSPGACPSTRCFFDDACAVGAIIGVSDRVKRPPVVVA